MRKYGHKTKGRQLDNAIVHVKRFMNMLILFKAPIF